jgi:hypothetical protein
VIVMMFVLVFFMTLAVMIVMHFFMTVAVTGVGAQGRARTAADAGTNQLAGVTGQVLAQCGTTQGTHGTAQGGFVLVASVGGGGTTGGTTQSGTHQGAGITAHLFAQQGTGGATGTTTPPRTGVAASIIGSKPRAIIVFSTYRLSLRLFIICSCYTA